MKKEISKRIRISNASTIEMKVTVRQKVLGTPDIEAVRCDDWGREVLARLDSAIDMVSAEARYHSRCYLDFCKPKKSSLPVGRQRHPEKSEAFAKLCNFLISNGECQFSLIELSEKLGDFLLDNIENYSIKHLSRLLTQLSNTPGTVVSFLENASKILSDKRYTDKEDDIQLERRRIVKTACKISDQQFTTQYRKYKRCAGNLQIILTPAFTFKGDIYKSSLTNCLDISAINIVS